MLRKIIDHIEYQQTDDGWTARKVHDDGQSIMEHKITDEEIESIEAGNRPAWTILGLPKIVVNQEVFKENGELTTESWGFLLLTPLAFALALSPSMPWETTVPENQDWEDEEEAESVTKVPNPEESGFDVPVL